MNIKIKLLETVERVATALGLAEYPKVFDMDHNERTFVWAKAKYGVSFERFGAPNAFRLVKLQEVSGPNTLVTQVLDADGQPMANVGVAFYWPDAPSPPEPPTTLYPHDWRPNFVHGPTNLNGDVGNGLGKGAYHGLGQGGPHEVWVRHPGIPSDICQRLGMLAGTPHDHLNQTFQLEENGTEWPDGKFVEVSRSYADGVASNGIVVALDSDSEVDFYDTRVHLVVGEDPDNPDWTALEMIYPTDLNSYEIPTSYVPQPGETSRKFWFLIHEPDGSPLSEFFGPYAYATDITRRWSVTVTWADEEPPSPPPPSPPTCGWTMSMARQEKPGLTLLAGTGLPHGTEVTISAPGVKPIIVEAGSKTEYNPGGWLINIWHPGLTHTVSFGTCSFTVEIAANTIVILTFIAGPPPPPKAHLESGSMDKDDAKKLLDELEALSQFAGKFTLVEE